MVVMARNDQADLQPTLNKWCRGSNSLLIVSNSDMVRYIMFNYKTKIASRWSYHKMKHKTIKVTLQYENITLFYM